LGLPLGSVFLRFLTDFFFIGAGNGIVRRRDGVGRESRDNLTVEELVEEGENVVIFLRRVGFDYLSFDYIIW